MDAKQSNEVWIELVRGAIRDGESKEQVGRRYKGGALLSALIVGTGSSLVSLQEELFEMLWAEAQRREAQQAAQATKVPQSVRDARNEDVQ